MSFVVDIRQDTTSINAMQNVVIIGRTKLYSYRILALSWGGPKRVRVALFSFNCSIKEVLNMMYYFSSIFF